MTREHGIKLVANNRKAYHDYFIEETFEAGLELVGTEVKSLRDGRVSLREAFVEIRNEMATLAPLDILDYLCARGSVDGVTRANTPTEDGLPAAEGMQIIQDLRILTGFERRQNRR